MRDFDARRVAGIAEELRRVVDCRALLLERAADAKHRKLVDLLARWNVLYLAEGLQDSVLPEFGIVAPILDLLVVPREDLEHCIAQCIAGGKAVFIDFTKWARGHVAEYGVGDEFLNALTGKTERRRLVKDRAGRLQATIGVRTSRPH